MKIGKAILVIDDEENIREIYRNYLDQNFSNLSFVDNAVNGLEFLKKHKVDVMLVDLTMPQMSGFDFMEIVKKKYPEIICIIVSGNASLLNLHHAIRIGVFDFIEKPFSQTTLLEKVEAACKQDYKVHVDRSLKSAISEINKEMTIQKQALLLELREEILQKCSFAKGNWDVLQRDLEQFFDCKMHSEKSSLQYCLTPTEKKISEMLDAGITARIISRRMGRSLNTIQVHIRSIRRKLGLVRHRDSFSERAVL